VLLAVDGHPYPMMILNVFKLGVSVRQNLNVFKYGF
jgi:hypothetical protein